MENRELEWPWDEYDEARSKRASKVKFQSLDQETAIALGSKVGDIHTTTLFNCDCMDFHMNLHGEAPCKHIIAFGIALGLLNASGRTPEQQRQHDITETRELIARAAGYYYIFDEPIISDKEYDALKVRLAFLTDGQE